MQRNVKDIRSYYRTFGVELTSDAVVLTLLHSANKLKLRHFYLKSMIASEIGARTVDIGWVEGGAARHLLALLPSQTQTLSVCFVFVGVYI
jgi:hypothetical protein